MSQIRITPEQARDRARNYEEQADKVDEVITRMDSLIGQLEGEIEGRYAQAFFNRYSDLRPSVVQAKELIGEISRFLENMAADFESVDSSHG